MSRTVNKVVRYERKDMFRLGDYMRAEYKKSGLNNKEFAAKAAAELGLPGLNNDHIRNMLLDLGIEPNVTRTKHSDVCDGTAMARLVALEEEVRVLSAKFERLIRNLEEKL